MLGDISYPMFLSHWMVASVVNKMFPALHYGRVWLFLVAAIATFLFSLGLVRIEHRVNRQRKRLKERLRTGDAPVPERQAAASAE